jgi:hypothetical protein
MPSMDGNAETVSQTVVFLWLAAAQLRRIAELEISVANELRHGADQCIREAEDLAERLGIELPPAARASSPAAQSKPGEARPTV